MSEGVRPNLHRWCQANRDDACETCADFLALLDERDALAAKVAELGDRSAAFERRLTACRERRDAAERKVARVEALFAGGPDTPCRTTWREEPGWFGLAYRVECVEVPMDDLRAALGDHS